MKYLAWRAVWRVLATALCLLQRLAARLDRVERDAEIEMLLALADRRIRAHQRGEGRP